MLGRLTDCPLFALVRNRLGPWRLSRASGALGPPYWWRREARYKEAQSCARWHTVFRRRAPPHLPRHLLFRILAYRLQADRLGELDNDSRRVLDRIGSGSAERIERFVADLKRSRTELRPGTLLTREWGGRTLGADFLRMTDRARDTVIPTLGSGLL